MSVADAKDALRARMRAVRKSIPVDERVAIDAAICERVCAMPAFQKADVVLSYLSMGAEIETRGIVERAWQAGKTVALPRCTGPRRMSWYRVVSLEGLERSSFGVGEPADNPDDRLELGSLAPSAIAIVPGFTFDAQGYRLGYGGGFYDTFLADFIGTSIGLCRTLQLSESLVAQGVIGVYDLPVDMVVSEE